MNRQGTESSLSLSSECLSLDAQQNSTLLTYSNVLNDFLLEMQPQTYASGKNFMICLTMFSSISISNIRLQLTLMTCPSGRLLIEPQITGVSILAMSILKTTSWILELQQSLMKCERIITINLRHKGLKRVLRSVMLKEKNYKTANVFTMCSIWWKHTFWTNHSWAMQGSSCGSRRRRDNKRSICGHYILDCQHVYNRR